LQGCCSSISKLALGLKLLRLFFCCSSSAACCTRLRCVLLSQLVYVYCLHDIINRSVAADSRKGALSVGHHDVRKRQPGADVMWASAKTYFKIDSHWQSCALALPAQNKMH